MRIDVAWSRGWEVIGEKIFVRGCSQGGRFVNADFRRFKRQNGPKSVSIRCPMSLTSTKIRVNLQNPRTKITLIALSSKVLAQSLVTSLIGWQAWRTILLCQW